MSQPSSGRSPTRSRSSERVIPSRRNRWRPTGTSTQRSPGSAGPRARPRWRRPAMMPSRRGSSVARSGSVRRSCSTAAILERTDRRTNPGTLTGTTTSSGGFVYRVVSHSRPSSSVGQSSCLVNSRSSVRVRPRAPDPHLTRGWVRRRARGADPGRPGSCARLVPGRSASDRRDLDDERGDLPMLRCV